jgi:hypothetical protein
LGTSDKSWRIISSSSITILFVSTLLWFVFPVLSILPLVYMATTSSSQVSKTGRRFMLLLVSISFGLIAFTAESVSNKVTDIFRYQELYDSYSGSSFSDIGMKNPLFDSVNYILANYITGNSQFVGFFWITLTYLFLLFSVIKISSKACRLDGDWVFLIIVASLTIIPFVWVTELIKQSISFSIFAYALSKKLSGEKNSYVFSLAALLLHIPVIILLPIYFYDNKFIRKYIVPIAILCFGLSFFNILELLNPIADFKIMDKIGLSERIKTYTGGYGFVMSKRFYLQLAFFVSQIILLIAFRFKKYDKTYLVLSILSLSMLLVNMGNPHNFVRLIYVYFPFYIFVLVFTISSMEKVINRVIVLCVTCSFYAISNAIMTYKFVNSTTYSNHYMDNDLIKILFSNVGQFFQYSI